MNNILDKALEFYKLTGKKPTIVYLGYEEALALYNQLSEIFILPRIELFYNLKVTYQELTVIVTYEKSHLGFGI